MTIIFNATQHATTVDQKKDNVIDMYHTNRPKMAELLTFDSLPTKEEMIERANAIGDLLLDEVSGFFVQYGDLDHDVYNAMIGGAPFFMGILEQELKRRGFNVYYAFSVRESVETIMDNGTVQKTNKFKHLGLIQV